MDDATTPSEEFSQEEMSFIAEHLAESASYLSHLSQLWLEEGDDQFLDEVEIDLPGLTASEELLLRKKVFGRLQRNNFTAKTVKLGTEGFMQVLLAMVRPLLSSKDIKE